MDSVRCMKSFESEATLLAGYRRLDSAGDDQEPMTLCSSEDEYSDSDSSDLDSASDSAPSPCAVRPMTDSLDLHPLLGSPRHCASTGGGGGGAPLSRHVPSWVMRTQQDDNNANAVPASLGTLSTAMSGLSPPLSGISPLSPAIEKAEIEKSEKPTEINGNMVVYKDGARPKAVVDRVKTSRHTATVTNKSPKHHRRSATVDEMERREMRVHFSNDAGVPRKQEKMVMNTSLKMGLESPRRPRPNTLPVVSRQVAPRPGPPPAAARPAPPPERPESRPVPPPGGRPNGPIDGGPVAPKGVASGASPAVRRREKSGNREEKKQYRKSCPAGPVKEERPSSPDGYNGFDVYNLETSLPKIDWDAIENHLKSVREEERKRRNDREAIRRKLAMGHESEDGAAAALGGRGGARPGRKPSLQSRLQGGMNLQICFMNETASDEEEEEEELGGGGGLLARRISGATQPEPAAFQSLPVDLNDWPKFSQPPPVVRESGEPARTADFVRHQAQLQTEARLALAQAKQMARMQMEIERQSRKSPISDVVRVAFQKIGVPFPDGRRRVSRQLLTEMNIAQLQVIVNDFHTRIEGLNEALVRYLMERDEQHMEQDSKLVHIEDLTSYFGQKHQDAPPPQPPPPKPPTGDAKRKPLRIGLGRAK